MRALAERGLLTRREPGSDQHPPGQRIYLRDTKKRKQLKKWTTTPAFATVVAFLPDGKTVLSGDNYGYISFWTAGSDKPNNTVRLPREDRCLTWRSARTATSSWRSAI
jgi:WD40 repeat protein